MIGGMPLTTKKIKITYSSGRVPTVYELYKDTLFYLIFKDEHDLSRYYLSKYPEYIELAEWFFKVQYDNYSNRHTRTYKQFLRIVEYFDTLVEPFKEYIKDLVEVRE